MISPRALFCVRNTAPALDPARATPTVAKTESVTSATSNLRGRNSTISRPFGHDSTPQFDARRYAEVEDETLGPARLDRVQRHDAGGRACRRGHVGREPF